ncbi:MAG: RDD family protein [Polyangiales bacterium]|nr:RDD family protein [Myxococcales bacterium]MCB9662231.1 RDD family protein [Sandaracinaceae bacterium]
MRELRDIHETVSVTTPENVTFQFELAGPSTRAAAWLVDLVAMSVLLSVVGIAVSFGGPALGAVAGVIMLVTSFVVLWWYGALLEWWLRGQTLGKRLFGLRVLQLSGLRITFPQAVIRNLVRMVDLLPVAYLVGGAAMVLDRHGRRLGDLAAGTIVVRERTLPAPATVVPPALRYNTFMDDPNVRHAVRRVTAPERDAMVALGMRRDTLPLHVRHDLFEQLATHLEVRLGLPRPPQLSAERYVLNIAALVLSGAGA